MIRLISIHIPKTAGRSFHAVLKKVYGEKRVFNVTRDSGKEWNAKLEKAIPPGTAVLHGHFTFSNISKLHEESRVPIVAWLRDPVERVISHYYFFLERTRSGFRPQHEHRRDDSLTDYVRRPINQNRMSRVIEGIPLKDLFFAGVVEYFAEDLRHLGELLGWRPVEPLHINNNEGYKAKFAPVGEDVKKIIRALNQKDEELYEEALQLRARRMAGVLK